MANKIHVKKGDTVAILAGKDIGKQGKILYVLPKRNRIIVEGINFVKRHTRRNPQRKEEGGIITREAPIHISNVMFVCPNCNRPARIGRITLDDGSKVRICKKCKEIVEKR